MCAMKNGCQVREVVGFELLEIPTIPRRSIYKKQMPDCITPDTTKYPQNPQVMAVHLLNCAAFRTSCEGPGDNAKMR